MAAEQLFRVVRTITSADGDRTLASSPIPRAEAMERFEDMAIGWRMDRVRVVPDQDYRTVPRHLAADTLIGRFVRWIRSLLRGGR